MGIMAENLPQVEYMVAMGIRNGWVDPHRTWAPLWVGWGNVVSYKDHAINDAEQRGRSVFGGVFIRSEKDCKESTRHSSCTHGRENIPAPLGCRWLRRSRALPRLLCGDAAAAAAASCKAHSEAWRWRPLAHGPCEV